MSLLSSSKPFSTQFNDVDCSSTIRVSSNQDILANSQFIASKTDEATVASVGIPHSDSDDDSIETTSTSGSWVFKFSEEPYTNKATGKLVFAGTWVYEVDLDWEGLTATTTANTNPLFHMKTKDSAMQLPFREYHQNILFFLLVWYWRHCISCAFWDSDAPFYKEIFGSEKVMSSKPNTNNLTVFFSCLFTIVFWCLSRYQGFSCLIDRKAHLPKRVQHMRNCLIIQNSLFLLAHSLMQKRRLDRVAVGLASTSASVPIVESPWLDYVRDSLLIPVSRLPSLRSFIF